MAPSKADYRTGGGAQGPSGDCALQLAEWFAGSSALACIVCYLRREKLQHPAFLFSAKVP